MRRFVDWVTANDDRIEWVCALALIFVIAAVLFAS